ncbi:unnamed protein product [Brassica rapa]|uniref:Uncharacterized protein n=1 Tax=Brassica campestris TaxID=3711 RepID=A0A3P6DLK4_BRACM|nr:unnamed protein product [Brassica rapa]VDD19969.1 unnamed protein product [Brassica rapa]
MKGSVKSFSLIPISFCFLFLFRDEFAVPARHLCHPQQREAILELKNEFQIQKPCSGWTVSWVNNSDCCSWDGIACDATFGDVIELNLGGNCIHGELNSKNTILKLQSLPFLQALDLSDNYFSGNIPSSLGNLSKLTFLDLSKNAFNGEIPSSLGNLSNLTILDLSQNKLIGKIPSSFGRLKHLTGLYAADNELSGNFPVTTLLNLTKLLSLSLYDNQFTGMLPPNISSLSNLVAFYISGNALTGTLPSSLFSIPSLLYNMFRLDISNNKIKGQVPGWLWELSTLQYLDLSNNTFTSFESPKKLRQPSSLEYFFGANNNFTGEIPSFICELRSLTVLDLSSNKFNGSFPRCIGKFSSVLEALNLRQNRLSGRLPKKIISRGLKSLDIGHNKLAGKLLRSLIASSSLEVLNVESNRFNDTFPSWLSSLPELQVLVLRSNAFHGPIHQTWFSKLRIIDISHNRFNGMLPSNFFVNWTAMYTIGKDGDQSNRNYMGTYYYFDSMVLMNKGVEMELVRILTIYTALDFSENEFEGVIPSSIGLLKELLVLNLSGNAFTGHIPSSMGNLSSLESLDLSRNKLTGAIPQELGNLSYLAYMNFSHNQLVGLVPGGTQFRTQPCSSFKDNPGLFGPSLDQACVDIHEKTSHQSEMSKEEEDGEEEVISWIAAAIGFIPGIAFGFAMGYIVVSYKPEWFINRFGRTERRRISPTRR